MRTSVRYGHGTLTDFELREREATRGHAGCQLLRMRMRTCAKQIETYMQAYGPPMNVILRAYIASEGQRSYTRNVQYRTHMCA